METLRIDRLEARYRLPLSRREESGRLDRALRLVMDEALERALERLGYPLHEEICIREVHAPVRLRLSADEEEMALAWSLALARSLGEAVREGRSDQVVRYGSRIQALVDFAAGAARGDLRRAWAWEQLGFGPVSEALSMEEAARALQETLLRESASIVPVLRALAGRDLLGRLAARLSAAAWIALAEEALQVANVSVDLGAAILPRGSGTPVEDLTAPELRRVRRAVRLSPLGRIALREPALLQEVRAAWVVLALLDADPGLLRLFSSAGVRALVEAVLHRKDLRDPKDLKDLEDREDREDQKAKKAKKEGKVPFTTAVTSSSSTDSGTGTASEAGAVPGTTAADLAASAEPSADLPLVPRQIGETARGGLLFLISVMDGLGLPDEIAEAFRERSFRWSLHRLALILAPLAPEDPAALAFAGLPPDSEVPFEEPAEPSPVEQEALAGWAGRIVAELRERLPWEDLPDALLLDRITRRSARIAADPGWLDVHLALADVSTDLRRARLDLDPGYVPWLGVVLRFLYD